MALFASLKHRSFALLWSGQTVSRLGDNLYRISLAWWVLEKSGSATTMGTVFMFTLAPTLLFTLVGGVLVDRLPRLRVILVADILGGLVMVVAGLLASANLLEIWHVYVASALLGLITAFFMPAYAAVIPEIIPDDVLPSANSLTSLSSQLTGIAGPALGALVMGLAGASAAFLVNGISFFISAALAVPLLKVHRHPVERSPSIGMIGDLREAIGIVARVPWLWITIMLVAVGNVTETAPIRVALPFFVKDILHGDVGWLGILQSLFALGLVIGAVWVGRAAPMRRRGITAYCALMIAGSMVLVLGLPISMTGASLAMLIHGVAIALFNLIWTHTLQELVPREMLGRVASIDYVGSTVLLLAGYGLMGWAVSQVGTKMIFTLCGAVTIVMSGLSLFNRSVRGMD